MARLFTLTVLVLFLLSPGRAVADAVTFQDTVNYWPGFADPANPNNQNNLDVLGDPSLSGGTFNFTGTVLSSIALNYTTTTSILIPGDWFISFNKTGTWDYVVHSSNLDANAPTSYALYDISSLGMKIDGSSVFAAAPNNIVADQPSGTSTMGNATVWGGYDYAQWPAGYYGRYAHPARIDDRLLTGLSGTPVAFNGWVQTPGPGDFTALWSGLNIDAGASAGSDFTYAFAMLCANDVVYGDASVPTPESGTFVLVLVGLLAMVVLFRRAARR